MRERGALILVYHAVERGPRPLCVEPEAFGEQLDALLEAEARTLTMSEIVAGLAPGTLPERAVGITFDDGFASVAEHAVPALLDRGMRATVFCVAGHLGGTNEWATQPASAPRRPLAGARQLAEVAALGFEIGSHGVQHVPLALATEAELEREIVESRSELEQLLQVPVRCFAYPYGSAPGVPARRLLERTYAGACGTCAGRASGGSDPFLLPRVDVHYVHRPALLRAAAEGGLRAYLGLRRVAAVGRRRFREDFDLSSSNTRSPGCASRPPSRA